MKHFSVQSFLSVPYIDTVSVVNYAVKDTSFHLYPGNGEWKYYKRREKWQLYILGFLEKASNECDRQAKIRASGIMNTPLILA